MGETANDQYELLGGGGIIFATAAAAATDKLAADLRASLARAIVVVFVVL